MARLALYSIFVVIFSLFVPVHVVAQSPGQIQLDITARDHYTRAALWEVEEQDRVVTDWEVSRGFERA
jgi:hypothetical protein